MIRYSNSVDGITTAQLEGFFVGWPTPPTPETHLNILKGSDHVVLAMDDESGAVVGFVTAVSDGVLAAYLPLLEVLPSYQGQGIGRELMRLMLDRLADLYMVDLVCDEPMFAFYESLGMKRAPAMVVRRRDRQSGENAP